MENHESNSSFDSFELHLTNEAKDFLKEAGKWANFLAVLGFVGIGFIVILSLVFIGGGSALGSAMEGMGAFGAVGGVFIGVVYLLMALLYFFPVLYLYRFGSRVKQAFANNDAALLSSSLENLKSHYKFAGILAIIMLSLYALIFVFAILGALM